MKIQLPKTFQFHDESGNYAYVQDKNLYMSPNGFEKIMFAITYALKGEDICYYCHRPLRDSSRTLDHVFPRVYGGISIPNNLKPCCAKCNMDKRDLLASQYKQICQNSNKKKKREAILSAQKYNYEKKARDGIILPKKWYEMRDKYAVIGVFTSEQPTKTSKKYQNLQEFYETYHKICKPVVVSANGFVLDGFMVLFMTKNLGITPRIPFITLENVIVEI